ncbi:hypothetical protein AN958_07867, partial [Leucoagaricus sp. SymC.cos]
SHTNHNQIKKAHRNGIRRPQSHRTRSLKGVRYPALELPLTLTQLCKVDPKVWFCIIGG